MYGGSGVAVAAPDEKLCPRTLCEVRIPGGDSKVAN